MELFDVLIFGAVFYYIVKMVRRAASGQRDKRPPGSIATEEGKSLSWAERTQRALEGALEWEEEQEQRRDEAEVREEVAAMRAAERETTPPWRRTPDEQRRTLEAAERDVRQIRLPVSTIAPGEPETLGAGGAAPALSDALAGVASMLEQRASREVAPRERAAPVARRQSTSIARRSPTDIDTTGIEVEAHEIVPDGPGVTRWTNRRPLAEMPGLERLTPLQQAIVYGEIFGRPVALGGGVDDTRD